MCEDNTPRWDDGTPVLTDNTLITHALPISARTLDADPEKMRQLIFYADGRLTYDWQYEEAILLGERS